jgi:polyisoprenoid-binding protein YceI
MSIQDALPTPGSAEAISGRWLIDRQRSSVEFRAKHFWGLVTVKGQFEDYRGQLDLSGSPAIELTINAASVQTDNRKRDQHLRSADFFDTENHPQVRFVADSVAQHGDTLTVRGRLSANGRSIKLEVHARVHRIEDELEIEASTTAPHRELGMTYSPLRMIGSSSQLAVKGRLTPHPDQPI